MTAYPFSPSPLQNVTFNPVMAGQTYTAVITWNLFGQRWYLNLYDSNGNLIISTAVVASQDPQEIADISWSQNRVTVTTTVPHWMRLGSQALLYLSGNVPEAYDGLYTINVTGPNTFTFALDSNPGLNTVLGRFGSVIDLAAGQLSGAMLLYYASAQQFATTP